MKIDIPDSVIIEQTRVEGVETLANYVQLGGAITPDIREHIADVLRGNFKLKRGPKAVEKQKETAAKVTLEISRVMYFWDVSAYRAQKMLLDFNPNLEDETMATYWKKDKKKQPTKTRTFNSDGIPSVTRDFSSQPAIPPNLTSIVMEFLGFVGLSDMRGKLAGTNYPEGYQIINVTPLEF